MKHKEFIFCFIIFVLIIISSCSTSKVEFNQNSEINIDESIQYSATVECDKAIVSILNSTVDTIYLFDSYLTEENIYDAVSAKETYRYNKNSDTFKLSFLPLLPYLAFYPTDKVILGEKRLVKYPQILYSFHAIPPKEQLIIEIPLKYLPQGRWIDDFNVTEYNKWDSKINFTKKTRNSFDKNRSKFFIELCVYYDISDLNKDNFYYNEFKFNQEIKNFKVLNIPILLDSE